MHLTYSVPRPPSSPPGTPLTPAAPRTLRTLVAQIRDGESDLAFQRLQGWCRAYVEAWHWQGLNEEAREEIVGQAIVEAWPLIGKPTASEEHISRELRRALDKHKKQAQRCRDRSAPLFEMQERVARSQEEEILVHEEEISVRRSLKRVVGVIVDEMTAALGHLSDRDHDLIVLHYGLKAHFRLRASGLDTLRCEARRKAIQRARQRFNEILEANVRQAMPSEDAAVEPELEMALRIVRGGLLVDVLKLFSKGRTRRCCTSS